MHTDLGVKFHCLSTLLNKQLLNILKIKSISKKMGSTAIPKLKWRNSFCNTWLTIFLKILLDFLVRKWNLKFGKLSRKTLNGCLWAITQISLHPHWKPWPCGWRPSGHKFKSIWVMFFLKTASKGFGQTSPCFPT